MSDAAGTTELFGYRVDLMDELGRGAFGTVYMGHKNGMQVAMKRVSKMNKQRASAEAVRYHYMKENIKHRNIVKVFDVKSFKDSMWIIMEFCEGGDLNDFFINSKDDVGTDKFQKDVTIVAMKDIAEGLTFLHGKDIVHRDIKPANILMKTNAAVENSFTAKLADFGLSKMLDPEDMTSAMSSDVGTTVFKAPEFWDREPGEKARYHRNVDVYATGLTFAAMLQAKPGQNLVPRAQCELKRSETNMTIGLIAFSRKRDVNLLGEELKPIHWFFRTLITSMTRNSPQRRISAEDVTQKLTAIMINFGQNTRMEGDNN